MICSRLLSCLIYGLAVTAHAQNTKSSEEIFKSRMSRWIEVIGRESLTHEYARPVQGRYSFDWERIQNVLLLSSAERKMNIGPEIKSLARAPIFSKEFAARDQHLWVKDLLKKRKIVFGKAERKFSLTRQTFILNSFTRAEESLDAYQKEVIPSLKWMYLWDAAVECTRLHSVLNMQETHPWTQALDEARESFVGTSLGLQKPLISTLTEVRLKEWLSKARTESIRSEVKQQNSIAWFLFLREGIESLIVLFCVVGSLSLLQKRWVFTGSLIALAASFLFYIILRQAVAVQPDAEWIRYFALCNVVISLGILLFATNFQFHSVYWSGWISKLRVKNFDRAALFFAGFFAIFREGVELSLSMSLLSMESGAEGVTWAFLRAAPLVILFAFFLFVAHAKLPLRLILVSSGLLMILVTVVFAGFATRLLQAFDWLDSTPLVSLADFPAWVENVFAYNGTVECTLMMGSVALFLIVPAWPQLLRELAMSQKKYMKIVLNIFSKSTH